MLPAFFVSFLSITLTQKPVFFINLQDCIATTSKKKNKEGAYCK